MARTLLAIYPHSPHRYDEMLSADGGVRPHWQQFFDHLDAVAPDEMRERLEFVDRRILHPALNEGYIHLALAHPLEVLGRPGRSLHLKRNAAGRQQLRVAFGIGVISAGLAARGDRHASRRRRLDKTIGHRKTQRGNHDNRPGCCQQIAERNNFCVQFIHRGSSIVEPVVLRASRSRCALAASASA